MVYAVIIGYLYKIGGIKAKKFMRICRNGGELASDVIGHKADARYCILLFKKVWRRKNCLLELCFYYHSSVQRLPSLKSQCKNLC